MSLIRLDDLSVCRCSRLREERIAECTIWLCEQMRSSRVTPLNFARLYSVLAVRVRHLMKALIASAFFSSMRGQLSRHASFS